MVGKRHFGPCGLPVFHLLDSVDHFSESHLQGHGNGVARYCPGPFRTAPYTNERGNPEDQEKGKDINMKEQNMMTHNRAAIRLVSVVVGIKSQPGRHIIAVGN